MYTGTLCIYVYTKVYKSIYVSMHVHTMYQIYRTISSKGSPKPEAHLEGSTVHSPSKQGAVGHTI